MRSLCLVCVLAILASTFTLAQTNPVPLINQPLVPDAVTPGGKDFQLTVNGTGFVSASVVTWNSSPLATTFVSGSQLTATVPAADIAKANTASVTVASPGPGGGTSNVTFFQVAGTTSFSFAISTIATGPSPQTVVTRDLNGDGKLDLVTANFGSNSVSVLLGKGNGTFLPRVNYRVGTNPVGIAVGDFNGDGNLDLAVANVTDNTVSILLGNGDGTFKAHKDYATGVGPGLVAVADFNGDGNLDLAVTCNDDTSVYVVSVLLGNGDGTFETHKDYTTGSWPSGLAIGDFDQDGNLDIAIGNAHDSTVSVLLGNGDGTFRAKVDYQSGNNPRAMATSDVNADGKLDLVVASQFSNAASVLLGNGDGTFPGHSEYGAGNAPVFVELGDFNRDGNLDLVLASFNDSTVNLLPGNGDGTFRQAINFNPGINPNSIAVGDFNGDGRLDLAVANLHDNTLSIMLQNAAIAWSPAKVTFGLQVIGTHSTAQKINLTNVSNSTVTLRGISITGTDSGDFHKTDNCGSSLPPKAHCTIRVTFKPAVLGPRTAAVKIRDDAPGSPEHIPLNGVGVTSGPNATLSRKNLAFPLQLVGTTSPAQPVKLTNLGTETLNITSIVASGDFGEKNDCGSSLPPLGSCTIDVTFTPTRGGHRTGTLTITDNAPDSPQKVSLTGAATVVKLDPTSLDFGSVTIGQQSSPQDTTLTNVRKTRLHITGIAITGTDSGDFLVQQDTCPNPGYLGGGKSCTITVVFKPTLVGSRTADVSISDDGGGSPQQVSLSGTGMTNCSGPCSILCRLRHCECRGFSCIPASVAVVEETASRLTCSQINPFKELR